eukprot:scaffold261_cov336-Pavlova_lutheri.AAC.74
MGLVGNHLRVVVSHEPIGFRRALAACTVPTTCLSEGFKGHLQELYIANNVGSLRQVPLRAPVSIPSSSPSDPDLHPPFRAGLAERRWTSMDAGKPFVLGATNDGATLDVLGMEDGGFHDGARVVRLTVASDGVLPRRKVSPSHPPHDVSRRVERLVREQDRNRIERDD